MADVGVTVVVEAMATASVAPDRVYRPSISSDSVLAVGQVGGGGEVCGPGLEESDFS